MKHSHKTKSQINALNDLSDEKDGLRQNDSQSGGNTVHRCYKRSFLNINEAVCVSTLNDRILDCNQKHVELFGYLQDEIKGMKLNDFHPSKMHSRLKPLSQKVLKDGVIHFETPMVKKNGDIFPAAITAILVESDQDHLVHSLIRDLSEREKTVQDLKTSEKKYKLLFEQSYDAIIIHKNGRILDTNQRTCKMLGYSKKQLRKLTLADFHAPSEQAPLARMKKRLARTKKVIHFESRWKTAEGEFIDVEIYSRITDIKDRIFMSTIRDITQRKQNEARIRDSEQKFRSIFDHSPDGIVLMKSDRKPLALNPAFCRMHGYSPEEVRAFGIGASVERDDPNFKRFTREFEQNGRATGEVIGIHKDGSRFPIELTAVIFSNSDEDKRLLSMGRDISRRKRMEAELKAARKAAEQASRAKSEFLANMSHEIRTPLNGVVGVLNLLLNTELSRQQLDLIQTGKRSAGSLLTVINDILDFSKIEADQLDLETIDFNLRSTVADIIELPALQADEKGLEFIYQIAADIPVLLRGDPGRLRQIILNLTSNAIKFTAKGEVVLQVSLENETGENARVRFEVSDTGIGIPPAKQKTIFDAFKQSDSSTTRRYGGTGLGLSISKRLVTMMGGDIGVTSIENKGSVFWFTVVLEKQPNAGEHIQMPPPDIQGKRFLLVDDNRTNLEILKGYIEAWDCSCDVADSGEVALSLLHAVARVQAPYDAAIIDMLMPEMDGAELGRRIKSDPLLKDTKMVMLTSLGLRGDARKMQQIGYAAYLTKPIRRSRLYDCLAEVLSRGGKNVDQKNAFVVTQYSLPENRIKKPHILIVEDNGINLKLALKMVEHFGFDAGSCSNGKEALRALEKQDYDLVLMDVQMPEMDGLEATRLIRSPESRVKNHDIKIIAMTAHAMKGDRELCLDAGMDDYICKPIQPEKLLKVIERSLGH